MAREAIRSISASNPLAGTIKMQVNTIGAALLTARMPMNEPPLHTTLQEMRYNTINAQLHPPKDGLLPNWLSTHMQPPHTLILFELPATVPRPPLPFADGYLCRRLRSCTIEHCLVTMFALDALKCAMTTLTTLRLIDCDINTSGHQLHELFMCAPLELVSLRDSVVRVPNFEPEEEISNLRALDARVRRKNIVQLDRPTARGATTMIQVLEPPDFLGWVVVNSPALKHLAIWAKEPNVMRWLTNLFLADNADGIVHVLNPSEPLEVLGPSGWSI